MEITLEKIELVKDRTGVTYAEAKEALEEADGSVVDAIIAIEETINAGEKKRGFGKKGEALFTSLKELIKKGNIAKIQVKRDGEIILNVPVNAGIVGVVIAPIASVVAVVAAFGFKCTIEVVKDDGTIIDVSDTVTDVMSTVAEKSSTMANELKEKGEDIYQKSVEKGEDIYQKSKEFVDEALSRRKKDEEEFDFSECFEEDEDEDRTEVKVESENEDDSSDTAETVDDSDAAEVEAEGGEDSADEKTDSEKE